MWGFSFGRACERAGARTRCEPDAALESDAASLGGMGRKRSAAELRPPGQRDTGDRAGEWRRCGSRSARSPCDHVPAVRQDHSDEPRCVGHAPLATQLVGKLDAIVDRKASVLRVHAIHEDVRFTPAMTKAVQAELEDLASWLGLSASVD